jgi:hypothetical protein
MISFILHIMLYHIVTYASIQVVEKVVPVEKVRGDGGLYWS